MTPELRAVERPAGRSRRTLDPFAFPSDTRGWFRMLVLTACLVGFNLGFLTAQRVHGSLEREDDARERLANSMVELMGGRDLRDFSPAAMAELGRRLSPVTWELLRARLPRLLTSALLALLLLAGAVAVYLDHPRRYRRHHRSRLLAAGDAPTVVRDVERWAANLELPALRLEHRSGRNDEAGLGNEAQTFGLRGRETLLFHGDPWLLERVWGETLKAVALHELGHVKNGDAQEREKSRAVWIALSGLLLLASSARLGIALLDLAVTWRTAGVAEVLASLAALRQPLLQDGWRLAALLLLAAAIWTGLVRGYELYADRRVATWGRESALQRLLRLPDTQPLWHLWHPSNRRRREVLADPVRLFRVSPALAFLTGVLLAILTVNLILPLHESASVASLATSMGLWRGLAPLFLSLPAAWTKRFRLGAVLLLNLGRALLIFLVPLALLSHLAAGTLGTQVQRETMADLEAGSARTWGYARLWRPATLLALGVEAGFWVAPFNSSLTLSLAARPLSLWLVGLTCLTWLWLAYVRALTRFSLGVHVGSTLSRPLRRFVSASSVVLLTALYWPAAFVRLTPRTSFWLDIARRHPADDPREVFVYSVVVTGVVLAILAIVIYLAGAGASLVAVFIRLRRRQCLCPACAEPVGLGFTVGRRCALCGEPLAAWAYAPAALNVDRRPEGAPSS